MQAGIVSLIGIGIGLSFLNACVSSHGECGTGRAVSYRGSSVCVYATPITEEGFSCPRSFGNRFDFEGYWVCSSDASLPEGIEPYLEEEFFSEDEPPPPMVRVPGEEGEGEMEADPPSSEGVCPAIAIACLRDLGDGCCADEPETHIGACGGGCPEGTLVQTACRACELRDGCERGDEQQCMVVSEGSYGYDFDTGLYSPSLRSVRFVGLDSRIVSRGPSLAVAAERGYGLALIGDSLYSAGTDWPSETGVGPIVRTSLADGSWEWVSTASGVLAADGTSLYTFHAYDTILQRYEVSGGSTQPAESWELPLAFRDDAYALAVRSNTLYTLRSHFSEPGENRLRVYPLEGGPERSVTLAHEGRIADMEVTTDGRVVIAGDFRVDVFDATTGASLASMPLTTEPAGIVCLDSSAVCD